MSGRVDVDATLLRGVPLGVRRARRAQRSLRWRMAAAPLVAAVVVGLGAVELARSPIARPAARPAGEAAGPTAELAPGSVPSDPGPGAADPGVAGTDAGAAGEFPPARPAPETEPGAGSDVSPTDAELLAVAHAAVEAWGRFASSGVLGEVADHYVADGPQYRQFTAEAGARQAEAGGPPYRFALTEAAVLGDQPAGDRMVRGTLELTREGQPAQRYRWDLRLRRVADGTWRVWTVLESSA